MAVPVKSEEREFHVCVHAEWNKKRKKQQNKQNLAARDEAMRLISLPEICIILCHISEFSQFQNKIWRRNINQIVGTGELTVIQVI